MNIENFHNFILKGLFKIRKIFLGKFEENFLDFIFFAIL